MLAQGSIELKEMRREVSLMIIDESWTKPEVSVRFGVSHLAMIPQGKDKERAEKGHNQTACKKVAPAELKDDKTERISS